MNDPEYEELTKDLIANFNTLADEVQLLSDRNTILQHKLSYAHSEYQVLADKYAPSDPGIADTLAKLQLPHEFQVTSPDRAGFVPLPLRTKPSSKQQTAEAIRDGRKVAQRLAALNGKSTGSTSISAASSRSNMRLSARRTSLSTVLEQDFTVPGKKGSLSCPFTRPASPKVGSTMGSQTLLSPTAVEGKDTTPHQSADPICAAMYAETRASPPPSATGSAAKCPIRYLDQHSPEEVARYFETHKHEIPRSHEVCVKRYQRNEHDIRQLDAKYGNLVSMIQGLGQTHKRMLPTDAENEEEELERTYNERVENWATTVSADGIGQDEDDEEQRQDDEDDRASRYDRTMKPVRVGESPSRPWGISVPMFNPPSEEQRPASPPAAPVSAEHIPKPTGKCPFGHGKEVRVKVESDVSHFSQPEERPVGKCPFPQGQQSKQGQSHMETSSPSMRIPPPRMNSPQYATHAQPAFIQPPAMAQNGNNAGVPQMIFTGPVFIGYPMEQALAFMQQYKHM
ncbi:hypothetical protein HYALB_00004786 [Hymenoscyphus albidus]|uniref:Uncharacterized protein n=1 Tax=Hymenoscyphus albidus TaxID=595503 RepID=A0A9N9LHC8_9HELO|nr:hypothetical protein HYALB_00004786 [Hymenoscyphus albidus]